MENIREIILCVLCVLVVFIIVYLVLKCNNKGNGIGFDSRVGFDSRSGVGMYKVVFSDNFDSGSVVDTTKWKIYNKHDPTNGCVDYNSGGKDPDVLYQKDGNLIISPKKTGGQLGFKSARISSVDGYGYGYYESKLKVTGRGKYSWPAFWLTSKSKPYGSWPESGEIDIMESINNDGTVYTTIHCGQSGDHSSAVGIGKISGKYNFEDFNTFSVNWLKDRLDFYVNSTMTSNGPVDSSGNPAVPKTTFKFDTDLSVCASRIGKQLPAPFSPPNTMKIILNYDIGGQWPGDSQCKPESSCACPGFNSGSQMVVDSVTFWENSTLK